MLNEAAALPRSQDEMPYFARVTDICSSGLSFDSSGWGPRLEDRANEMLPCLSYPWSNGIACAGQGHQGRCLREDGLLDSYLPGLCLRRKSAALRSCQVRAREEHHECLRSGQQVGACSDHIICSSPQIGASANREVCNLSRLVQPEPSHGKACVFQEICHSRG